IRFIVTAPSCCKVMLPSDTVGGGERRKGPPLRLLYQLNRRFPEVDLVGRWIQNGHLTIISARRQFTEAQTETQRNRLRLRVHALHPSQWRCLEHLGLTPVERDECNQRT